MPFPPFILMWACSMFSNPHTQVIIHLWQEYHRKDASFLVHLITGLTMFRHLTGDTDFDYLVKMGFVNFPTMKLLTYPLWLISNSGKILWDTWILFVLKLLLAEFSLSAAVTIVVLAKWGFLLPLCFRSYSLEFDCKEEVSLPSYLFVFLCFKFNLFIC